MVTEQIRTGLHVRHQARSRISPAITGAEGDGMTEESVSTHLHHYFRVDTTGSPALQRTFLIPPGAALCQDELTEHGNVQHLILCHSDIFGDSRHGVQAQR